MEIVIRDSQKLIKINQRRIKRIFRRALSCLKDSDKLPVTRNKSKGKNPPLVACHSLLPFEISVLFVDDRKMKALNSRYRGISGTTDVLSFPQYDKKELSSHLRQGSPVALGDIVVSVPRAGLQAKEGGLTLYDEITRLLIHGLLHLFGYDHEKNAYQARKMRKLEEELYAAQKMDL